RDAIQRFRQRFSGHRHFVNPDVRVVADQLPVQTPVPVQSEAAVSYLMARVCRACRVPEGDWLIYSCGAAAQESAAADSYKSAVPIRGWDRDPNANLVAERRVRSDCRDSAYFRIRRINGCGLDHRVRERNHRE